MPPAPLPTQLDQLCTLLGTMGDCTATALRDATAALRDAPKHNKPAKQKRKGGIGRLLLVAIIGGAVAVAVSESLRNKVLDALFGAEEEFDYTSNTTPPAPPEAAPST